MVCSVSELQSVPQSAEMTLTESSTNACATNDNNPTTKPVKSEKATDAKAISKRLLDPYKLFNGFDMVFFIHFYYVALKELWCGWNKFTPRYFWIPFFGLLILLACVAATAREGSNDSEWEKADNFFQACCWVLFAGHIIMIWP